MNFFQIKDENDVEQMQIVYDSLRNISSTVEDSEKKFFNLLKSNNPFYHIRLGDMDLLYLMYHTLPEKYQAKVRDGIWLTGINPNSIPPPDQLVEAIKNSTMCGIAELPEPQYARVRKAFHWYGVSYWGLQANNLLNRQYDSLHFIYKCMDNGSLFNALADKEIIIVGSKAKEFHDHCYRSKFFRDKYPHLGLEKLNLSYLQIPNFEGYLFDKNHFARFSNEIRNSYSPNKVYLFSCGIPAKIYSYMVYKENNSIGIDVGSSIATFLGIEAFQRPFMRKYQPEVSLDLSDIYSYRINNDKTDKIFQIY